MKNEEWGVTTNLTNDTNFLLELFAFVCEVRVVRGKKRNDANGK
jgi:hypothetical protein